MDNMSEDRVSLKHYVETLFKQYKEAHEREHELLADNVNHTRENLDLRLIGMNQFREQILSERGLMVSNDKCEAHMAVNQGQTESYRMRLNALEVAVSNMRGRMTATAAAISVGLVIIQLVLHFVVK